MVELASYSDEELIALSKNIASILEKRKNANRDKFVEHVEQQLVALNIDRDTLHSLLSNKGAKRAVKKSRGVSAMKYQDPSNPEKQWSGMGRKPFWVTAYLNNGKLLSDLEIK